MVMIFKFAFKREEPVRIDVFTFVCVTVDPGNIPFAVRGCAVTSRTPVSRQLRLGGEVQWPGW